MVCTVCFLSWWKILAWGIWNFELVQIFLINWNWIVLLGTHGLHCLFSFVMENSCLRHLEFWACPNILDQLELDCFVRHASFALSNWNWIVLLGMHGLHCLCSFVIENSCLRHLEFQACPNIHYQLELECFVMNTWSALSVFFHDGKFLLEVCGILSLSKFSWSIGIGLFC